MRSLRPGTWIDVRSADEILATLDERGRLDGLPFMPEMLQFCGKRFRISTSAHKSCDTIKDGTVMRHMQDAVHLEAVRCDGQAHGGCQAGCLLFWKKAWLKPAGAGPRTLGERDEDRSRCTIEALARATRAPSPEGSENDERYACQATELVRATTPIHWWDPRHYVKDLTSGNIGVLRFVRFMAIAAFNNIMRLHWRGRPYPYVRGLAGEKTPADRLDLRSGDMVQVRSKGEIMRTLNSAQKNRGLWFDVEMVPFCGKTFRVLRRVDRLINEKNGAMSQISRDCIVLEGVTCSGCFSDNRLFCPRSVYPYWREIWLKRIDERDAKPELSAQRRTSTAD